MNILGTRIRDLRKDKKLNQEQLATALNTQFNLNIDRVMISKWETGFQTPVMNTIVCLAKFFDVSIDYLNGGGSNTFAKSASPSPGVTEDYVTFPVIGEVAAGFDHIAVEDWEGDKVDIPISYLKGRRRDEFFVLRVKGDSMYPTYQDGDKVLILRQSSLDYSGQVGVVIYNNEYGTLKKVEFVKGEDWMRMIPINPMYAPETIIGPALEECQILGTPKLLIREIQ